MIDLVEQLPQRFSSVYKGLVLSDMRRELLGQEADGPSLRDLAYLVSTASRLALNADIDSELAGAQCQLAYDIAVRVPKFANGTRGVVVPLCEGILSRIGNFPARSLLKQTNAEVKRVEDPFLEIESAVREEENASLGAPKGVTLTDFQVRLLEALRGTASVSVSAPTSAGKSFTLELELLHRLRKDGPYTAIFLVPTRALIRQVSVDLAGLLREEDVDCSVLSSISVPDGEQGDPGRRFIFVLTQERFASLLAEAPANFNIDAVIVDEAQEIGKDKRGITLERVIRLAIRRFPRAQLFFSSPLRSNPEYLLSLFSRPDMTSAHFVEHQRPVTQNLILVRPVKGETSSAELEISSDLGLMPMGRIDLPFKFRGRYLVHLAKHFTAPDDVSIIYCNRPSEADKVAAELGELLAEKEDDELDEFGGFLQQEVHRYYRLGAMVRKGIAFHYANIPQIVRSRIEEFAKLRKLRFICCTSTLLQGVNLPAKNIFLENPKTGQGETGKILPGDFWNLVGRAGRMNHEFSGNVFCVYGKTWDSDPLSGDRMMVIESAFQVALTERAEELAIWATKPASSADGSEAWAEQAFANIDNISAAGMRVTLQVTVINTVNNDAIGSIVQFAAENSEKIFGVLFQPIMFAGRDEQIDDDTRYRQRYTLSQLAYDLKAQSKVAWEPMRDWWPMACYGIFSTYVDMVHPERERGSLYVNEHPDSGIFSPMLVNRRTGEWQPISSFFNFERFLKDVTVIIDAARSPILSKAQMMLAFLRNFDAMRAPNDLTAKDLLGIFRQCTLRTTSQIEEWSQKIYDRQNWTVMFMNADWFQDLFLYELPNLELATSVVVDPGLDPERTVNSEVVFSFKNAGGWRQVAEWARHAPTLSQWHSQHGRHRIYANGRFVSIDQLRPSRTPAMSLVLAPAVTDEEAPVNVLE